jgi:linoleoyl-CoA desaturase
MLVPKWQFLDDARDLIRGRVGISCLRWPKGRELALLIGGKASFLCIWFVLPAMLWPVGLVIIAYAIVAFTLGMLSSLVFQLAHCVEEAQFTQFTRAGDCSNGWERHQIEATVNFAGRCRWLTWYVGGSTTRLSTCSPEFPCSLRRASVLLQNRSAKRYGPLPVNESPLTAVRPIIASFKRWARRRGRGAGSQSSGSLGNRVPGGACAMGRHLSAERAGRTKNPTGAP